MAVSTIPNPNIKDIYVSASTNIDTLTQTGFYTIEADNNSVPDHVRSGMIIIDRGTLPIQLIVTNNNQMYFRVKYSSGWQPWRKVTSTTVT